MRLLKQYLVIFLAILMTACGGDSAPVTPTSAPDTTAPYVSSANPTGGSVVSALTSVDITFSEDVTGADVFANYSLSGVGVGTLILNSVTYTSQVATLSIAGLVNNGTIDIGLDNVADIAGNALPVYTLTISGTTTSPTQTAVPASGTNNLTSLSTVEITYSKEMQNVTDPANYILSGTASGTLSLDTVTLKNGTTDTYVLTFSGTPNDGILNIDITGITDLVDNVLVGTNINYTFDMTAPQISTTDPASGVLINVAPTIITVNYSEIVNGKDLLANYVLSGTAIGGVTITNVVSASSQSSAVYLSGAAVEGSLILTINNIIDPAGNALTGSNTITFDIDPVAPTRSWTPVDGTTINALSSATVTYSEPVLNGDNIASYNLIGNSIGTLAIASIANTPPGSNTYILSFSGSPVENAAYKDVSIVASYSPSVTDLAGNIVASQLHWYVDQTPPTLLSFEPVNGSVALTELSNIRVEFSESMSADVTDPASYSLSGVGAGSLTVGTPVLVSGNIYDIPLSGAPGVGDVTLSIAPTDVVGNIAAESITYTFGAQATIISKTSGVTSNLVSVATDGGRIIAIASDSVSTIQSVDGGATWGIIDALACGMSLDEIIYAGGQWTTIGGTNAGYTAACNSADGAAWANYSAASGLVTTTYLNFIGVVHNGTDYAALGGDPNSGIGTQCMHSVSADAQTWPASPTYCLKPAYINVFNSSPNGIHYANGNYFITGSTFLLGPVLSVKADLTNTTVYWANKSALTSAYKVIHDGTNYLVAGASSGGTGSKATIALSPDLATWTSVSLPDVNTWLYDIAYDATGGYIAVGNAGLILTSSDGSNWTQQIAVTTADLNSVMWDVTAANWVVVGSDGTVLTVTP
ncbi:MAG: Ig-like domain-containing protein [Gammaproteobacteria bacterium]|nr:Ig-like domain-containing protein [Gammaproteobacteria bacterium]